MAGTDWMESQNDHDPVWNGIILGPMEPNWRQPQENMTNNWAANYYTCAHMNLCYLIRLDEREK